MTVALRSPQHVGALIPVDNAPVDANLKNDFHKYVQGLREIEEAQVKKHAEADAILKKYEEVGRLSQVSACLLHNAYPVRPCPSGNSSSLISCVLPTDSIYDFVSPSKSSLQVSTRWEISNSIILMRFATMAKH